MTDGLRILFFVLYLVGGLVILPRYLKAHPPQYEAGSFKRLLAPWIAITRMWGPLLWFVPPLFWIGILDISPVLILLLGLCIPLCIFILFMLINDVSVWFGASSFDRMTSPFIISLLVFFTLILMLFSFLQTTSTPLLLLFCIYLVLIGVAPVLLLVGQARTQSPLDSATPHPLRNALNLLIGYFSTFPKPTWIVEDGKVTPRIPGNPFYGLGPGYLLTEPENLVILKTGSRVNRLAGPGGVLTDRAESPFKIVDLRNQIRMTKVNAITRDGIHVRVPISCRFRIQPGHQSPTPGQPWPYRHQRDVFNAVFSEEVDPSGTTPLEAHMAQPWEELPLRLASHKVRQVIAYYSLNQLYEDGRQPELVAIHQAVQTALGLPPDPDDRPLGDSLTRVTIGKLVTRAVREELGKRGFEIIGGGIGNKIEPLNPGVTQKRVEAWKAQWSTQVMAWQAELQTRRIRDFSRIRRGAYEKLIANMAERLQETLQQAPDGFRANLMAYQLVNHLIQIARTPQAQEMLPESALNTLTQLLSTIGQKGE